MTLKPVPHAPHVGPTNDKVGIPGLDPTKGDKLGIPGYDPYPYPKQPPDEEYWRFLEEWKRNHPPVEVPPPPPFESQFYTNVQLKERGWTRTLRERFLGRVDHRLAVNHWKNWYGKDAYFVRRVHLTEITPEWEAAFLESAQRRKLPQAFVDDVIKRVHENRAAGVDKVIEDTNFFWGPIDRAASSVAAIIEAARARGLRTPHKC